MSSNKVSAYGRIVLAGLPAVPLPQGPSPLMLACGVTLVFPGWLQVTTDPHGAWVGPRRAADFLIEDIAAKAPASLPTFVAVE